MLLGPAVLLIEVERSFLPHLYRTFYHITPKNVFPCEPNLQQFLLSSLFRFHSLPCFAYTQEDNRNDALLSVVQLLHADLASNLNSSVLFP
jgi:hypothetical protein